MDDLDILSPVPVVLSVRGTRIEVLPLRMRQWKPVIDALGDALPAVLAGDLRAVVCEHEKALATAVAAATELPAEWLCDLYPNEFAAILGTVVRVNRDFFDLATVPVLAALYRAFVPAAARGVAGGALPPGSSPADTASTTS